MTVQIIRQRWDPKLQVDVADYAGLSTDVKPTILTPGSTFHESDTGDDYISGALGWTAKPAAAAQAVALSGAIPAGTNNIGDVGVATLPGTVQTDIAAMKADIALIKAQNLPPGSSVLSFIFDEDDLSKDQSVTLEGLLKHLHLVVPDFTNSVTATVTLKDASGRVYYTSAAKAKGFSYNLDLEIEWLEQVLTGTLTMTVTLSGAAGGSGGTVVAVLRYFGASGA